jgi:hypothetical protein
MPINRTIIEQETFCKAWKQSGLSKVGFCKQNNISKSALYKWLSKFNSNGEVPEGDNKSDIQSATVKFLQINDVNSDKVLHPVSSVLEITMPNGIGIKTNLSQSNFNIFMQELLKWK